MTPDKREECGCHRECTTLPHECETPCRWPDCLTGAEHAELTTEVVADETLPRPSAATIITMAGELPPRTFRVWLDAHDG